MLARLKHLTRDLRQTWTEWGQDDGTLLAAAVAYYTALSLFPLLLVLISGLGFFLEFTRLGQNAEEQVLNVIGEQASPLLRKQVAETLSQLRSKAPINGPVGLATLLLGAISIFSQFEKAFDRVWNVEDPERRGILAALKSALYERGRAFFMLLCVALLILTVFVAGLTLQTMKSQIQAYLPSSTEILWAVAQFIAAVALNALAFALLYKFLPKAPVRWRHALAGGALVALTWEIGRQVLAAYLIGGKYTSAYGVVGSFLAVMLWVYYASTILLLGAEYVQVIVKRDREHPPSMTAPQPQ